VDPLTWEVSDLEAEGPGEAHETLELLDEAEDAGRRTYARTKTR
jgi:hypothetical protein